MSPLARDEIATAFRDLSLEAGDVVFVHSSLSSMGYVEGGAEAVVDAFLDVLGPDGTLAVPAFTFSPARETDPVFDPANDPSEMGRVSEATRTRPGARRSCHLTHSVAALGAQAEAITKVQGAAAWAGDGPFWQLYKLDARIMMLGVPYLGCTFFHVVEQLVQSPYRRWADRRARVRDRDGTVRPLPTKSFSPKPGFAGNDFNKFGAVLEDRGLAAVGPVGNAMARIFRARDGLDIGVEECRKDPMLFVQTSEAVTPLRDGVMTGELHNEKAVVAPELRASSSPSWRPSVGA